VISTRSVVICTLLAILFLWCADSVVDALFFTQRPVVEEFLKPNPQEIYMRALLSVLVSAAALLWALGRRQALTIRRSHDKTRENYQSLVESFPDFLVVHRDEMPLYANEATLAFLGVADLADLRKTRILSLVHPDYHEESRRRLAEVLATGRPSPLAEIRVLRGGGMETDVVVSTALVEYEGGDALLTFMRDITDQMETRRDLLASRERLQLALDAARDGVWDWDIPTGSMVYNQAWAEMLGYALEEVQPDKSAWLTLVHPEDHAQAAARVAAHLKGESPVYEAEVRLRHKDGHYLWVLDRGKVVARDQHGQPARMTGTHRNITARKEAELALEIRNRIAEVFLTHPGRDTYRDILEVICEASSSPAGLFGVVDSDGGVSIKAGHPAGLASLSLSTDSEEFPEQTLDGQLSRALARRESIRREGPISVDSQHHSLHSLLAVPIVIHEQVIGMVMCADRATDYTSSEQAFLESLAGYIAPILHSRLESETKETQLRQAQKMEALGALAGGIAHDFNNILQAIMGFTTLAREDCPAEGTLAADLDRVLKATGRGKELVQRILLFSRREEQERQPVAPGPIVAEAVNLLRPSMPSTIEIMATIDENCGEISADPSQINQAVMNLATNAYHAMEVEGGTLEIELFPLAGALAPSSLPRHLLNQDLVVLTVSDSGCGMNPETLDRLFDPFFTTKDVGKGTGLGLSVVHGIVTAHYGAIQVESQPGVGTTVTVYLPGLESVVDEQTTSQATEDHGYRILFVDDEEDIAAIGKALLEKQGHQVTSLTDGAAALTELMLHPSNYDLVITDLTMPRLTGLQLADKLAEIRLGLPVIIITGVGDQPGDLAIDHPTVHGVIRKPFGGDDLRATVNRVMASSAVRGGSEENGPDTDHRRRS